MRTIRLVITGVAVAALIPLTASGALAAPPPANDKPDGAMALDLGDTISEDTTDATTDAQDAELNQACGAPFTNASVWFTYKAGADGTFVLDMQQSDYTGGFMVFAGQPSQGSLITCGPTTLGAEARAGTKYFIMVFSDTQVKGGDLELSLEKGPPAPRLEVTVNPDGKAFQDGTAAVSGTFSCKNAQFFELDGQLTQIWRRVKITGFFFKFGDQSMCDGQAHPWRRVVESDNGLYAKGEATIEMFAGACGPITCTDLRLKDQPVKLHASGRHARATDGAIQSRGHGSAACSSATPLYSRSIACRM